MPQRIFIIAMLPVFLFLILFLATNPVEAATVEYGESITIGAEETIDDDIYCFGDTVNISGTILGDAVIFARQANIDGTVRGSLLVFAETIRISGNSAGSVRGAANSFSFNGSTSGDLMVAADRLNINGSVQRDIYAAVGNLFLGPETVVGGNVNYYSTDEAALHEEAIIGGTLERTVPREHETAAPARSIWSFVRPILSLLLVTALIVLLFPNISRGTINTIKEQPSLSLGIGALIVFTTPLAAILLLLTVIGAPLSILSILTYAVLLYLTRIFAGYFLGRLAFDRMGKELHPLWVALIGVLVLSLLVKIPYIGWFIHLVAVIFAAGALLLHLTGKKKEQKAPPVSMEPGGH